MIDDFNPSYVPDYDVRINKHHHYESDQRFGMLRIQYPDEVWGVVGRYRNGYWIAQCDCGATVRVNTHDIQRGIPRGRCCMSEECRAKWSVMAEAILREHNQMRQERQSVTLPPGTQRVTRARSGRPPLDIAGKTIGRLTPQKFVSGLGWICVCGECGGELLVPNSAQVAVRGMRKCGGECVV